MKLSIVIPVYNEAQTIDTVIRKIKSVTLPGNTAKEIIIVDDKSTDDTAKRLEQRKGDPTIKIYQQDKNMGKSSAVRMGLRKATGDIILIQDADLEYNPDDYPQLIYPIIRNEASVVYGSRFKGVIEKMPLINRFANIMSNMTINLLSTAEITDLHTCYKVFKKEILTGINITSKDFAFDAEITVKIIRSGYKICEIPITYVARTRKEGKKITWMQALDVYRSLIVYWFNGKA